MLRSIAIFCAASLMSFAYGKTTDCNQGQFGSETYSIVNEKMNEYGEFKSTLKLSESGEFRGDGRYIVSEDGQFAYLETKFRNRKAKLSAVVSVDYQTDGGFMTLCMGQSLKKKGAYECISCLVREQEEAQ